MLGSAAAVQCPAVTSGMAGGPEPSAADNLHFGDQQDACGAERRRGVVPATADETNTYYFFSTPKIKGSGDNVSVAATRSRGAFCYSGLLGRCRR